MVVSIVSSSSKEVFEVSSDSLTMLSCVTRHLYSSLAVRLVLVVLTLFFFGLLHNPFLSYFATDNSRNMLPA